MKARAQVPAKRIKLDCPMAPKPVYLNLSYADHLSEDQQEALLRHLSDRINGLVDDPSSAAQSPSVT